MEIQVLKPTFRDIAQAHRFQPPVPQAMAEGRSDAIMLRYDGKAGADRDRFFVVIGVDDMSKLPGDLFSQLPPRLAKGDAFFRDTAAGPSIYLEHETCAQTLSGIRDLAANGEIKLIDAIGDIRLMGGPHDLRAPEEAAYEQNGFASIDPAQGFTALMDLVEQRLNVPACPQDEAGFSGP